MLNLQEVMVHPKLYDIHARTSVQERRESTEGYDAFSETST